MVFPAVQLAIHGVLLIAAMLFWLSLLSLPEPRRWHALPALLLTGKLVCLLAALLVFAPRALYGASHQHAALMQPLDDQQLAGLLMIAACPLSYLVAAVVITVQLINRQHVTRPTCCAGPPTAPDSRCVLDLPARHPSPRQARTLRHRRDDTFSDLLFLWSGVYSVAASRGHWAIMEWLLTFAMRNSVKTHALGIEAPPLDTSDLVTLGAGHFHSGCAFCHGAPGMPISPIAQGMLPPPPDLATQMRPWRDRELFWIVKNGIKYTGMPAWAAQQRDDEVWALVAFLRRLPALDPRGYRDLALGDLQIAPQSGREVATSETASAAVGACARCHGAERDCTRERAGAGPARPAGRSFSQPRSHAYAGGRRASGIMQPVAQRSRAARISIASRATTRAPAAARPTDRLIDAAAIERGRALAEHGDADARIPACAGLPRH